MGKRQHFVQNVHPLCEATTYVEKSMLHNSLLVLVCFGQELNEFYLFIYLSLSLLVISGLQYM